MIKSQSEWRAAGDFERGAISAPPSEILLEKPGYRVRLAINERDRHRAFALRARCFGLSRQDQDRFDATGLLVLVERLANPEAEGGRLVGCFRLRDLSADQALTASYCGQFYDLSNLQSYPGRIAELGRLCIAPSALDANVARLAWGALARLITAMRITMVIGCSSFAGTDPDPYLEAIALLNQNYLLADNRRPGPLAQEQIGFKKLLVGRTLSGAQDSTEGLRQMPSLLRSYLAMGGRVGDHLVIDRQLSTLHVFTALEIDMIPQNRQAALRGLMGAGPDAGG